MPSGIENKYRKYLEAMTEDSGAVRKEAMQLDPKAIEFIQQAIALKRSGVQLPFKLAKELFNLNHKTANNMVYGLNRYFKKHGIKLHAGSRARGQFVAFNKIE